MTEIFIPNEEVRSVFLRAVINDGWDGVMKAISASEALLKATLAMDERTVAQMIQEVHMHQGDRHGPARRVRAGGAGEAGLSLRRQRLHIPIL